MLANTLTLDNEDAVQEELQAMQQDVMNQTRIAIDLPSVLPVTEPVPGRVQGKAPFLPARATLTTVFRTDTSYNKGCCRNILSLIF